MKFLNAHFKVSIANFGIIIKLLEENYEWSYFLFFPYHGRQVSYIFHIILQNFQGSFIRYYYPFVQKGEQSLFVLGVVVNVYLQYQNPTVSLNSNSRCAKERKRHSISRAFPYKVGSVKSKINLAKNATSSRYLTWGLLWSTLMPSWLS